MSKCYHRARRRLRCPTNGILLLGIDYKQDYTSIIALDPATCKVIKRQDHLDARYDDDLEAIIWPAAECNDQSWLWPDD